MTEAEFFRTIQMKALTEKLNPAEREWLKTMRTHPTMQKLFGQLLLVKSDIAATLAGMPLWGEENNAKAIKLQGQALGLNSAVSTFFALGEVETEDGRDRDDDRDYDSDDDDSGDSAP